MESELNLYGYRISEHEYRQLMEMQDISIRLHHRESYWAKTGSKAEQKAKREQVRAEQELNQKRYKELCDKIIKRNARQRNN